jgi:hypothetical protein
MFLLRRALQVEYCLFNLLNTRHAADYNAFLSFVGQGITIKERKLQIVTGFVSPDFEAGPDENGNLPMRIKDDAAYLYVTYTKSPTCPWQPPWPASRSMFDKLNKHVEEESDRVQTPRSEDIDDAIEGLSGDDEHIVIPEAPPPKPRAKKVTGVDKAIRDAGKIIHEKKLNQHGVDVSGIPKFMLVGDVSLDDITAVKRDHGGVTGITVGGKKVTAAPPPDEPLPWEEAPREAKKKTAKKPAASKKAPGKGARKKE